MRQKAFNFAGQRFISLAIEAEGGGTLERQSQALFERAAAALAAHGLALDKNVVRSRVFGRTREARDVVSGVRGKVFEGSPAPPPRATSRRAISRPPPMSGSISSPWRRRRARPERCPSTRRCSRSSGTSPGGRWCSSPA